IRLKGLIKKSSNTGSIPHAQYADLRQGCAGFSSGEFSLAQPERSEARRSPLRCPKNLHFYKIFLSDFILF
ncbi:MAG: hypothetical protein ABIP51_06295, partial [Bacteroidia bacterium]